MKVTIIGTGYVGLVTGACLAEVGNEVLCLDIDGQKIQTLQSASMPIYEPGLALLIRRHVARGNLRFTTDVEASVDFGLVQLITVGTPPDNAGMIDLQYVFSAARHIGQSMKERKLVVTKSTVPVGTSQQVQSIIARALAQRAVQVPFAVLANPEFLSEGTAVANCMHPDRIVIGADGSDIDAIDQLRELYAPFLGAQDKFLVMDIRSAELTKYAANAMIATRISLMNEMALLAETLGADIEQVRQGVGLDSRIGPAFLGAGCGFGGSCLPKDIGALVSAADHVGLDLPLLKAVQTVNQRQKKLLAKKIVEKFGADLTGHTFAVWGLAFKPGTDDVREAPSLTLIQDLLDHGAEVVAYDPAVTQVAALDLSRALRFRLAGSAQEALQEASALVIVTDWVEFAQPDFSIIKGLLRYPIIFDGRNLYDPTLVDSYGLEYIAIGRFKR